MIQFPLILIILLYAPPFVRAQFEGEIHTKVTTRDGSGLSKTYLSKPGARNEIDIRSPKLQQISSRPYRLTTIHRFADPDLVYHVNDERKIYSVINLKKVHAQTKRFDDETYTVKRIGSDTIAGYACEKALLTAQSQTETEVCIATDIAGMNAWVTMMEQTTQVNSGMFKALKGAGLEGFPVKMVMRRKGEDVPLLSTEVIRAEAKSLPVSLFEVPSTYRGCHFFIRHARNDREDEKFYAQDEPRAEKNVRGNEKPYAGTIAEKERSTHREEEIEETSSSRRRKIRPHAYNKT